MKGGVILDFIVKYAKLNDSEQQLRLAMLNWCVNNGGELKWQDALRIGRPLDDICTTEFSEKAENLLSGLEAKHYLRRSNQGNICFLYPYSAYPTDYHVTLEDGRSFYAMCAIDAMGSAPTFCQSVKIRSHSRDTQEEIFLHIHPDRGILSIEPDDHFVATYYDTSKNYIDFNC